MSNSNPVKNLAWDNSLDIGVEPMNDDHKHLIDIMKRLQDQTLARADAALIIKTIDELASFAVEHFQREEAYFDSINYPGAKQHKEVHKNLLGRFAYHRKEFESDGLPAESKFFEFLNVWLLSHIKGIDAQYGSFAGKTRKAG